MQFRFARGFSATLILLFILSVVPITSLADEGMFLPTDIPSLSWGQLSKMGLKLKPEDIYNPNGTSLSDAVVIVGGGTGEFVSPDGLLLTNHHVAFDALVSASNDKNDYGSKGYFAHNRSEELPAKGYTISITQSIKDVTSDVLKNVKDAMSAPERAAAVGSAIDEIEAAASKTPGTEVRVLPMNEGLSYYAFTYFVIKDVRIAYAPPKDIGFFGGDDDNFEWPRHCGDFSFMRGYVSADGKPAEYSTNNVPYKPKKFLPISMGGVKDGDFTMVLGYPGSTRRYRESYSVAYNQNVFLPLQIDIFNERINLLRAAGQNDEALRVRLQSDIFSQSNSLKDFEGSVVAMRKANLVQTKKDREAAFTAFLEKDPAMRARYGDVLPSLGKLYDQLNATSQHDLLIQQLETSSDLIQIASVAESYAADKASSKPTMSSAFITQLRGNLPDIYAQRVAVVDREFLLYLLHRADELPSGQKIQAVEKRFGALQGDARRKAEEDFASAVTNSPHFATAADTSKLFDMSTADLAGLHEPLIEFSADVTDEGKKSGAFTQQFNASVAKLRPVLLEGMMAMTKSKQYPDANRTLRFTYGKVSGYAPRQAVRYSPFTTLGGVIEKDTGREPFDVPQKLKDLYRSHDFGPYATPDNSDVPADFLSDNDIIGGNSGSPIMNGRGEQVGIVFDGNYEGLGNDFFFNESTNRTISVDIRYVLFIADKFGGAGYLLKELDIRNEPKGKAVPAAIGG